MIRRACTVLLAVTIALAACAPSEEQAETAAEESASAEVDVQAIRALFQEYEETVTTGDAAGWLAFFTEDVVSMAPNEPTVIGREALQAWGQPYFDSYDMEETTSPQEIVVVGDWAFARLDYTFRATPKAGGGAIQDSGKGIRIYQRQPDGSWEISRTIWNSDSPLPGR